MFVYILLRDPARDSRVHFLKLASSCEFRNQPARGQKTIGSHLQRSEIDKSRKCHFEAVGEAGAVQKAIESFYFYFLLIFFHIVKIHTSMFFRLAKLGFAVVSPKFHIR